MQQYNVTTIYATIFFILRSKIDICNRWSSYHRHIFPRMMRSALEPCVQGPIEMKLWRPRRWMAASARWTMQRNRSKGWVVSPGISLLPLGMFCIPGTSHSYKLTWRYHNTNHLPSTLEISAPPLNLGSVSSIFRCNSLLKIGTQGK